MFFSRTNKKETSTLVVLIESGAVHMGVVLHTPNTLPVLTYETVRLFDGAVETSERLISRMHKALTDACNDVTKDALPHIVARRVSGGVFDAIRFVYSAPWYVSRGRKINIEHEVPTTYSARELDELVSEQGKGILPLEEQGLELIEQCATGWTVNGYPVTHPASIAGTRFSLNLFASALPKKLKQRVEETVARSFHAPRTSHHSIALVAAQTLLNTLTTHEPVLFVNLTGAMTELALVANNNVLDVMTFPEGVEHAQAAWSAKTGRLQHESSSRRKLGKGITAMNDSWQAGMSECLSALLVGQGNIHTLVLLTDTSIEQPARTALNTIYTNLFNQSKPITTLATNVCGSAIRVTSGALPGSPEMRFIAC